MLDEWEQLEVETNFPGAHSEPLGMPSNEAQQLAHDLLARLYVLPETLHHPQVKCECLRLAYMIQAYGLHLALR